MGFERVTLSRIGPLLECCTAGPDKTELPAETSRNKDQERNLKEDYQPPPDNLPTTGLSPGSKAPERV